MKNILKGGLGSAFILVLFYFASVHISSCSNSEPKIPNAKILPSKFPISLGLDTTAGGGSGPGFTPKTIIIVKCAIRNCFGATVPDSAPAPSGSPVMEMLFTTKDSIPANSVIHLMVYQSQDSLASLKDKKAQ